jgi:hypothetical protein
MAALGIGSCHSGDLNLGVRKLLSSFLEDQVLITYGAVLTLGQAGLSTSCCYGGQDDLSMAQRLALGVITVDAVLGSLAVCIHHSMTGGGDHSSFDLNFTTGQTYQTIALAACLGAGGSHSGDCDLVVNMAFESYELSAVSVHIVVIQVIGIGAVVTDDAFGQDGSLVEGIACSDINDTAIDADVTQKYNTQYADRGCYTVGELKENDVIYVDLNENGKMVNFYFISRP